jgi:hypothetical protein
MKALLAGGAAVAAAAGLMMGSAMHPDLTAMDQQPDPQMSGDAGVGARPRDRTTTLASYGANVPDYVLGTDTKKALAGPDLQPISTDAPPPPEVPAPYIVPDDPPLPPPSANRPISASAAAHVLTRAAYAEPAPDTVVYPSIVGGGPYAADAATGDDTTTLPLPPTG